jgi:hypothetical protein
MIDTRIIPSVKHGVTGEVNQIAAIDEWNNFHTRRQNVVVEFLDFLVNALQSGVCRRTFSQQHDP